MRIRDLFLKIPEDSTYIDERLKVGFALLVISFLIASLAIASKVSSILGVSMLVFGVFYIIASFIISGLEDKDKK